MSSQCTRDRNQYSIILSVPQLNENVQRNCIYLNVIILNWIKITHYKPAMFSKLLQYYNIAFNKQIPNISRYSVDGSEIPGSEILGSENIFPFLLLAKGSKRCMKRKTTKSLFQYLLINNNNHSSNNYHY